MLLLQVAISASIFFFMLSMLIVVASALLNYRTISDACARWGSYFVPASFIALGFYIMLNAGTVNMLETDLEQHAP